MPRMNPLRMRKVAGSYQYESMGVSSPSAAMILLLRKTSDE